MTQRYLDEFDRYIRGAAAAGPGWLASLRRDAIARFAELGVPTQKNEDWHFTSLQPLVEADLRIITADGAPVPTLYEIENQELGRSVWPFIVFVNGRFEERLSDLANLPDGMEVMPLSSAIEGLSEDIRPHLARIASTEQHSFTALNTAFMGDGAYVRVRRGAEPALPLRIIHVVDGHAAGAAMHPRSLILAEASSRASVIESWHGMAEVEYFTNAVTEVRVGEGATLNHYKLQRESPRAFHVGTIESYQERDSHYVSFSFATGARLSRTNVYTLMDGEGAGATLNGLYMVDGDQHVDHQTRIEHARANCFSREVYKGILDGESHGVFNGKVYVRPEAQKTDGKQSNNNLLLSDKARVDTKPQLEIFADDVKCTHGATVGRIDEQALFYMKSRGLDASSARDLLTYAFAAEVLEQIELADLRDELESLTLRRFTTASSILNSR